MSEHLLYLSPTDVLFFRDGRPMEGASSGRGAAWPLPHVFSAALHHAMHRAQFDHACHGHRPGRSSHRPENAERSRLFGSLQTVGPFPVDEEGRWLFPRPADAAQGRSSRTTHLPLGETVEGAVSSLDRRLLPVVSTCPPSKDDPESWISAEAYAAYLADGPSPDAAPASLDTSHFRNDEALFAAEHQIGIGISPETGTQDGERFYSASYLRLKEGARLGLVARCMDKGGGATPDLDLIAEAFPNSDTETRILAGGQQRTCTVMRRTPQEPDTLPLPRRPQGADIAGTRVRWTLLTPAIFPSIPGDPGRGIHAHPGGWLPTWIASDERRVDDDDLDFGDVLLLDGPGRKKAARVRHLQPGRRIRARLVAATIPRAIPVSGWSLPFESDPEAGGARATHLAVPAGAVYYFECAKPEEARKLAAALDWHGAADGPSIRNRRSALMGEKGYGLGVCSAWSPHRKSSD